MKKYDDADRLPISAIKQYMYCKRRFALMFIDREWESNYKIVEGDFLHEKVNDPFFNEKRVDIYKSRSVPVFSDKLNLYGIADIVEFIKDDTGVNIGTRSGLWRINPIEYKNGKPEKSSADNCQLCAVAMCLEEMFDTKIEKGDIFYGRLKRRVEVPFTDELRERVVDALANIQSLTESGQIPKKPEGQVCRLCSLANICMPSVFNKRLNNRGNIQNLLKKE